MSDDAKCDKSKDDFSPCFIHSAMNEFGFTPAQFRVLCHISSRGECWQSARNTARVCRMNEDTVWAAIKFLESIDVIKRTRRFGQTSILAVNPFRLWKRPGGKEGTPEKSGRRSNSATWQRKAGDTHPAEKRGHKLTNYELNPMNKQNGGSLPFKTEERGSTQFTPPTLNMVESYLEYALPGSRRFAEQWLISMQKQNWCDNENRPVSKWMPLALSYAKACMGNITGPRWKSPDRNAGTFHAGKPTDDIQSKVR